MFHTILLKRVITNVLTCYYEFIFKIICYITELNWHSMCLTSPTLYRPYEFIIYWLYVLFLLLSFLSPGKSVAVSSILLGLVLLGRAAFVFPLSFLSNLAKKSPNDKISFREQVRICPFFQWLLFCLGTWSWSYHVSIFRSLYGGPVSWEGQCLWHLRIIR